MVFKNYLGIVVVLTILLCFVSPVMSFSGSGSGTAGSPYEITNYSQLNEIRTDGLEKFYILMNDIECSPNIWTPMTAPSSKVLGTLDGNGKFIDNFTIINNGTGSYNMPL